MARLFVERAAHWDKVYTSKAGGDVSWFEAGVTGDWTVRAMDIWHDRAVLDRYAGNSPV
jgi:hypothetical protein